MVQIYGTPSTFAAGTVIQTFYPSTITPQFVSSKLAMCSQYVAQTNVYTNYTCIYNSTLSMFQFTIPSSTTFAPVYAYELGYFKNPSVSMLVDGWSVIAKDSSGNLIANIAGLSTAQILPNPILTPSVSVFSTQNKVATTYTFKFAIQDSIPAGGLVQITFPTPTISIPSTLMNSNTQIQIYSATSTTGSISSSSSVVTFNNFPSGLTAVTTSFIIISISSIVNPLSFQPTSSFSISTSDSSGNLINLISTGLGVTMTIASTITVQSIGPQTNPQVGQISYVNFNIILPSTYTTGGYISIHFPPEISIVGSPLQCTPFIGFINSASNCAYTTSTIPQVVSINSGIAATATSLYFIIQNIQNPASTKPTSSFSIYSYDSLGYLMSQVTSGAVYSVSPGALTNVVVSRASNIVGATNNYATFMFTTQNIITSGQIISFKVPYVQFLVITSTFKVTYNSIVLSSVLDTSSNSLYFTVNITTPCASSCAASTTLTFLFYGIQNPKFIVSPLTTSIQISTTTSDKLYLIDQISSGVYASPTLITGTLKDASLSKSFPSVGALTQFQLGVTLLNPIPVNGIIRLYFPPLATYFPLTSNPFCLDVSNNYNAMVCNAGLYSSSLQDVYYIEIQSMCSSGCTAGQVINILITNLRNPGSVKPIVDSFSVITYTSNYYLIDTVNITNADGLDLQASQFQSLSLISPISPIQTGAYQVYQLSMNTINGLTYQTGLLQITFPYQCTFLPTLTCTATSSGYSLTCSVSVSTQVVSITNTLYSSQTFSGSDILLTMSNKIQNPVSTQESSDFTFENQIYDSVTSQYYDADYDSSSIAVTPDTPNSLKSVTVVRSATPIGTLTDCTITFTTTNEIPSQSSILLYFPSDQIVVPSSSNAQSQLTFTDLIIAQSIQMKSIITQASPSLYTVIELQEWCSLGNSQCDPGTELSLVISGGLLNPGTTKPPTNSIQIVVQVSAGIVTDQIIAGVYATPLLSVGPFNSIALLEKSNLVGDQINVQFYAAFIGGHFISKTAATFLINFPTNLYFLTTTSSTPICYMNSVVNACSVSTISSTMGTYISSISLTYNCVAIGGCAINTVYNFQLSQYRNRFSSSPFTLTNGGTGGSFAIYSTDENGYSVDASLQTFVNSGLTNKLLEASLASFVNVSASNYSVNAQTDITVYFKIGTRLQKGSNLQVYVPIDAFTFISTQAFKCAQPITGTSITCSAGTSNSTHYGIIYQENCASTIFCPENQVFGIVIKGFKNRYNTAPTTSSFYLQTYTPDMYYVEINSDYLVPSVNKLPAWIYGITYSYQQFNLIGNPLKFLLKFNVLNTLMAGDYVYLTFSQGMFLSTQTEQCTFQSEENSAQTTSCLINNGQNVVSTSPNPPITAISVQVPFNVIQDSQISIVISNLINFFEVETISSTIIVNASTPSLGKIANGSLSISTNILQPVCFDSIICTRVNGDIDYDTPVQISLTYTSSIPILRNTTLNVDIPLTQFLHTTEDAISCSFEDQTTQALTDITCSILSTDSNFNHIVIEMGQAFCDNSANDLCISNKHTKQTILISGFKNPFQSSPTSLSLNMSMTHLGNNVQTNPSSCRIPIFASPPLEKNYFSGITMVQNSAYVTGSQTSYLTYFKIPEQLMSTSMLAIQFPDQTLSLMDGSSLLCTDVTGKITFTCTYTSWPLGYISYLTVSNLCTQLDCTVKTLNVTVKIQNVINVEYNRLRNQTFFYYILNSAGYISFEGNSSEALLPAFVPKNITSFTMVRSNTQVGSYQVSLALTFVSPNRIKDGSTISFIIPYQQVQFTDPTQISCGLGANAFSFACTYVESTSDNVTISFVETCDGDCLPNTKIILTLKSTINPPSLASNYPSDFFKINVTTADGYIIENYIASSGIVTPALAGIKITNVIISRDNYLIGAMDYIILSIPISSLLDSSTSLTLTLPVSTAFQGDSKTIWCQEYITGNWQNRTCSYTYYDTSSSQYGRLAILNMTMAGVCSTLGVCQVQQNLNIRFYVRNPFIQYQTTSTPFTLYFTSNQYLVGFAQLPYNFTQMLPNAVLANIGTKQTRLRQLSTTNQCDQTGSACDTWINITTSNPVPPLSTSSSQNTSGWLVINIPTQMTAASCIGYLFNTIQITCTVTGGYQVQVRHSANTISNSTLQYQYQILLQKLTRPFSTKVSDSFAIGTYQLISKQIFQIDLVSNGLGFQVSQPSQFSSITISRSNTELNSPTGLTFTMKTNNILPYGATILINLPESSVTLTPINSQITCSSGLGSSAFLCSIVNSTAFSLSNICPTKGCAAQTLLILTIPSQFILNALYIEATQTSIDSVQITSMYTTNGTKYLIDQNLLGNYILPSLTPALDFKITSFTTSSYLTSDIVSLSINIQKIKQGETFNQSLIEVGFNSQYGLFNQHPLYSISGSINNQIDSAMIINSDSTNSSIQNLVITCAAVSCLGQSALTINILNIQNIFYTEQPFSANQFLLQIQELYQYPDKISSSVLYDLQTTFMNQIELSFLQNPSIQQSNGGFGASDQLQLLFSLSNNPFIPMESLISLTLPNGFTVDSSQLQCSNIFDTSLAQYTCLYNNKLNVILIDDFFSNTQSMPIETLPIQINGVVNPSVSQQGAIQVNIYDSDRYYTQDTNNFMLLSQQTFTNCTNPSCALCGKDGTCYQCLVPSANPILFNKTCTQTCPKGYFANSLKCYQCAPGCATCQVYNQCSSCALPKHLADGVCINGACPVGTQLNSNNECTRNIGCEDQCSVCGVNPTFCYQCKYPFISLNGQCVTACPSSYFNQNYSCTKCSSICAECISSPDNCTSCNSQNITTNHILDLSINSCVSQCSSTSYLRQNNTNVCDKCNSQCATCQGTGENCTSCLYDKQSTSEHDLFYYEGQCMENCPAGLYQNYTDHNCSDNPFVWDSLPPLYLVSSVVLTSAAIGISKIVASKAGGQSSSDLFIVGLTQIEFGNRLMALGNLWFSTKTFSFCVTGLNLAANSLMGVYFATLIVTPMASQIQGASTSSFVFTFVVGLSQITGINTIRMVTSGFMGISALSNSFNQIPYYNMQLEMLSLASAGFSLFQMGTGISQFFDFSKGQDIYGFGANSLILNSALVGLQVFKYLKALKMLKAYAPVAN